MEYDRKLRIRTDYFGSYDLFGLYCKSIRTLCVHFIVCAKIRVYVNIYV